MHAVVFCTLFTSYPKGPYTGAADAAGVSGTAAAALFVVDAEEGFLEVIACSSLTEVGGTGILPAGAAVQGRRVSQRMDFLT
jgi:hypothetical protein